MALSKEERVELDFGPLDFFFLCTLKKKLYSTKIAHSIYLTQQIRSQAKSKAMQIYWIKFTQIFRKALIFALQMMEIVLKMLFE